jgi:hypothetical protein
LGSDVDVTGETGESDFMLSGSSVNIAAAGIAFV